MNAKFIIEQIVMSMSFLKADHFTEHKFIKQEDEHGMYTCLKAVIDHPETGYLQNKVKVGVATTLETIKEKLGRTLFNWSYLLDVLSEINKLENIEEYKEVLENFYYHLLERTPLRKVELFLGVLNQDNRVNPREILVRSYQGEYLNEHMFEETVERAFDLEPTCQLELLVDIFGMPKNVLNMILEKEDSYTRRAFTISSLRSFLFDKQINLPEPKGDSVSDDTQAVQEILNKPIKDKEMKQEQFYTKLYFYADAKHIIFSDGKVEDIAECFSKLSVVDQASVCYEFGILASDIQYVPGIANVLATMFMNMDMQNLKRKLSDLVSCGFIEELHDRLDGCKTWEDANKLHKYVMVTFNGMKIPDLKDIIVKYMSLDNHDQFDHNGTQLAGFFAGVIYADAMTMVKRHEEQLHMPNVVSPTDFGVISDDVGELYIPDIYDRNFGAGLIKSKQETQRSKSEQASDITMDDVLDIVFGRRSFSDKENEPKQPVKEQQKNILEGNRKVERPRIIIIKR